MEKELEKLIQKLKRTFDGDSNDAEHDAAVELLDYLEHREQNKHSRCECGLEE